MQYARQQVIDSVELNSKLFSLVIPVILPESSGVSVLALRAGDHTETLDDSRSITGVTKLNNFECSSAESINRWRAYCIDRRQVEKS